MPRTFPIFLSWETLVLSAIAWILCRSPLTGAFAYEFNAFLSLSVGLTLSIGVAWRLSKLQRSQPIRTVDRIHAFLAIGPSLFVPLIIVLINGFRVVTCRYEIGLLWFLLLPLTSAIFGVASAIWSTRQPRTPVRDTLWSLFPMFLFTFITLRDLAFDLPVFFHHPLIYFAGPIYDEWIPITTSVITYRVWVLLLSAWLLLSPKVLRTRVLLAVIIFLSFGLRQHFGWFHSTANIQNTLGGKVESQGVRVFFDKELPQDRVVQMIRTLQLRMQQIAAQLELNLAQQETVNVYLFKDGEQKKSLTGAKDTLIGNPMQRALHLLNPDIKSTLLPHELTHVLAAPFGLPGFGVSLRMGLLEGLATAVERYRDGMSVHELARALQKLDLLPNVQHLMKPTGFFSQAPVRSYLTAGSFCRWLLDLHGARRFKEVYRGRSFKEVYGKPIETLILEWKSFLKTIRISQEAVDRVAPTLKRKSVFKRQCPHDVAHAAEMGRKCQREKRYDSARKHFANAIRYSNGASSHIYELIRFERRLGNWNQIQNALNQLPPKDALNSVDLALKAIHTGDLAFVGNKHETGTPSLFSRKFQRPSILAYGSSTGST